MARAVRLGDNLWTGNGALVEVELSSLPSCGEAWAPTSADHTLGRSGAVVGLFCRAWDGEAILLAARDGSSWAAELERPGA